MSIFGYFFSHFKNKKRGIDFYSVVEISTITKKKKKKVKMYVLRTNLISLSVAILYGAHDTFLLSLFSLACVRYQAQVV